MAVIASRLPEGARFKLLVVVDILAILAGLLLGALSQAKNRAHRAGRISNARQLGLAFKLYVNDHDQLPTEETQAVRMEGGWLSYFTSYYGNPRLRLCPATCDPGVAERLARIGSSMRGTADMTYRRAIWRGADRPVGGKPWLGEAASGSYALNVWLTRVWNPGPEVRRFFFPAEDAVAAPSRTPVFADAPHGIVSGGALDPAVDLYESELPNLSSFGSGAPRSWRHGAAQPARPPGATFAPLCEQPRLLRWPCGKRQVEPPGALCLENPMASALELAALRGMALAARPQVQGPNARPLVGG